MTDTPYKLPAWFTVDALTRCLLNERARCREGSEENQFRPTAN